MMTHAAACDLLEDTLAEAGFALQALDEGRNDLARVHLDRLLRACLRLPVTTNTVGLPRAAARAHLQVLEVPGGPFGTARRTLDEIQRRASAGLEDLLRRSFAPFPL